MIADINKKICEMFKNKTPEIKHEVYKAWEKLKEDTKKGRSKGTMGNKSNGLSKDPLTLQM